MTCLYTLTSEARAVFADIDDNDGEMLPEHESRLSALQLDAEQLIEARILYAEEMMAKARLAREHSQAASDRARRFEARAIRSKHDVEQAIRSMGLRKLETATMTLRIQKNSPRVVLVEGAEVPAEYLRVSTKSAPDKSGAIMTALKAGEKLPFAHLEQSESMRVVLS